MSLVALDSSVIAEYANLSGRLHAQADATFTAINEGKLHAVLAPPTISELYYILARLYPASGDVEPQKKAEAFCKYIYFHPSIEVADLTFPTLIEAAKIKSEYKLALTDCYVLALAKLRRCRAIFRHREEEMKKLSRRLLEKFEIVFLEDYGR